MKPFTRFFALFFGKPLTTMHKWLPVLVALAAAVCVAIYFS